MGYGLRAAAFDREEGRGEIAVDRCSPFLLAHLLDGPGCGEAAAGVGDEDVDRAEFPFDPPAHGFAHRRRRARSSSESAFVMT